MIADMGTKPLNAKTLKIFMGALGMRQMRPVYMAETIPITQNQRKRQLYVYQNIKTIYRSTMLYRRAKD